MIQAENSYFALQTEHTTYAFCVNETGHLVHLYYGASIPVTAQMVAALMPKYINPNGSALVADASSPNFCPDDICQEVSTRGKGDMKEPLVELILSDGSRTSDFRYESYKIEQGIKVPNGLPGAYKESNPSSGGETEGETLCITLTDRNSGAKLELYYSVFEQCDCITRFAQLYNSTEQPIQIERFLSTQLDMEAAALKIVSFHGDWAREMDKAEVILSAGKFINDSMTGFSSNKANPFVMFGSPEMTEESGHCYAMNLLYSGNHRESFEFGGHGKVRMMSGIHPDSFSWKLEPGDSFSTPQAVLTFSDSGYRGISEHMHCFVREHIVRGEWKKKERPVLLNSWEATYFKISEKRLLQLAKAAKEDGMELFVLDDGWFGKRNDDKSSLGDWNDNLDKLPQGLGGLSRKVKKLGLEFGIWVEPEMISEDSDLYRAHPDWAVQIPGKNHALGRNQMLLDLSRTEIQDFIIEAMSDVFTRGEVSYVKWDMNRHMSDYYSQGLPPEQQGEFSHRYLLGLYRVMQTLNDRFPHILFEGCASGGNRFDLGMLCYMPQIWASDDSDAIVRANMQNNYSYGYPQSVYTAHVSACPNHQTLRMTPLETRYAVASAAVFGYECNLCDMSSEERKEIKAQVEYYKKWRRTFQFGQLYRTHTTNTVSTAIAKWTIVSEDKTQAVGVLVQGQAVANYAHEMFQTCGLDENKLYHFYNRAVKYDIHCMGGLINMLAPIHVKQDSLTHDLIAKFIKLDGEVEDYTVPGAVLNHAGVHLASAFCGTGYNPDTRMSRDYDARVYYMEEVR